VKPPTVHWTRKGRARIKISWMARNSRYDLVRKKCAMAREMIAE
jgi:hypothetical protein